MLLKARILPSLLGALLGPAQLVFAQSIPVSVRGIAFDNLRGKPLRDARITLVGGNRTATTDDRGRFQFDSVLPGVHTFAMQHAALDSLGFNGFSTRATITNGRDEVRIALPNFATLWRAACGGPVPNDGGFVYGTVRDADGLRPVANAVVEVSWTDMVLQDKGRARGNVVQRVSRAESRSDSTGSYALCSVAAPHWIRIRAAFDSSASALVDLPPTGVRLQRRDLLIGKRSSTSSARATISGMVTESNGHAFADARVILDGTTEVRTGDDGRFVIPDVVPGTRQIEVASIGYVPVTTIVDVQAKDTTLLAMQFAAATTLDGMKVVAARTGRQLADEFNLRRRSGLGYAVDSTEVIRFQNLPALLGTFPSLSVEYRRPNYTISMPASGGRCIPEIRIDGIEAGFGHIADLFPHEVAGVEIYNRALMVPAQFTRAGHPPECGMILVWTKYGFRNR